MEELRRLEADLRLRSKIAARSRLAETCPILSDRLSSNSCPRFERRESEARLAELVAFEFDKRRPEIERVRRKLERIKKR